ncbi:hypothetical protein [Ruminococcus sp.]|uniref:hypothetical protein n=1 Tax=Ruminococcus sp. TaxID=41978 RepID=UPI00258701A5|nr:hypothetical protein [Ruminococcus sp.]MCR5022526.1 hypothetical protein [Ruminococcus sp.]
MKARTNTNKKSSARKKLIPAAGSLMISAAMLSTSTYAWFTMSREVEVKNIQMTATTPEDIQISLGAIGSPSETNSLSNNGGFLTAAAPAVDTDWSNIADISNYYGFGKLIPASSTDGMNVYYTADAAGVGRTLKTGAKFYQAAAGATQYQPGGTTAWTSGIASSTAATAHRYEDATDKSTTWAKTTYTASTAWNVTNDDGYYVDIPVWLRTSSSNTQTIYVYGFACDKTEENTSVSDAANNGDDLYKAVRVAILSDSATTWTAGTYSADKGCLTLKDGGDVIGDQSDTTRAGMYPTHSDDPNILDSLNYNQRKSVTGTPTPIYAVSGLGTSNAGAWSTITQNDASSTNSNAVATLAAGSGSTFGTPTKLIIRVWLEGEDGNCWNENANQDWNIALKFTKDPLTASTGS